MELKPKQLLNDLKHAQVKILSFLTWMLRTFPNMVAPHQVPAHSYLLKHCVILLNLIGCAGLCLNWPGKLLSRFHEASSSQDSSKNLHNTLQDPIASALVRSLQTCPDIVSLRKELLVATRHVLSTPLKAGRLSSDPAQYPEEGFTYLFMSRFGGFIWCTTVLKCHMPCTQHSSEGC